MVYEFVGLGTSISLISKHIYNNNKKIRIDNGDLMRQICNSLNITKIKIIDTVGEETFHPQDDCKFFSPYYRVESINYKGSNIPINNSKSKPCVGLMLYSQNKEPGRKIGKLSGRYPYNKFHPFKKYSKLVRAIVEAGYDVLMFDSNRFSLEDKIYLMNEYCDMVIGYEGGIHHLAHTMGIPSIIVPWRLPDVPFFVQQLHLDQKTYFMSKGELDVIDSDKLMEIRNKLLYNQGNNLFLTHPISIRNDLQEMQISDLVRHRWDMNVALFPADIKTAKIGGVKEFTMYNEEDSFYDVTNRTH